MPEPRTAIDTAAHAFPAWSRRTVAERADLTPFSALALAALAERAGLPAGVPSIVTGRPEAIGGELTANPLVRNISFTGSTRIGALLMRQSAGGIKQSGFGREGGSVGIEECLELKSFHIGGLKSL